MGDGKSGCEREMGGRGGIWTDDDTRGLTDWELGVPYRYTPMAYGVSSNMGNVSSRVVT